MSHNMRLQSSHRKHPYMSLFRLLYNMNGLTVVTRHLAKVACSNDILYFHLPQYNCETLAHIYICFSNALIKMVLLNNTGVSYRRKYNMQITDYAFISKQKIIERSRLCIKCHNHRNKRTPSYLPRSTIPCVGENYSYVFNLRPIICKPWCLNTHLIPNNSD